MPNRFEYYTWYATEVEGGPEAGVYFVSHGDYTAQLEYNLGPNVTDANFPLDHTVSDTIPLLGLCCVLIFLPFVFFDTNHFRLLLLW